MLIDKDGNLYEGYFENGHYHGSGRQIKEDGSEYEGQWLNG